VKSGRFLDAFELFEESDFSVVGDEEEGCSGDISAVGDADE
jgi:hypothetical protein